MKVVLTLIFGFQDRQSRQALQAHQAQAQAQAQIHT